MLEIDFNQIESKEVNPEPTFIVKIKTRKI